MRVVEGAAPASRAGAAHLTPKKKRLRRYLRVDEYRWHWHNVTPIAWSDVYLPDDWYQNLQRILVPPIPANGRASVVEIACRRRLLPPDLYNNPAYAPESPHWDQWFVDEHNKRRRAYFALTPAPPQERTAYPAPPPGHGQELWFEEEFIDDDDPDLQAAYEASRRSLVEDEVRCWESVVQAAAQMPPPPPQQPALAWWQQLAQEHEAEELDLEPVPPLPRGLLGQSWVFTGGSWPPQEQEEPAQAQQEPEEQHVPPEAQPPPGHLWVAPGYVVLSDDED